jgi:membrane protein
VLFAMIFKVLPDVRIAWRDVWIGGVVTSLLFTGGKFLLGWYLGRSTTISAYGAAGSVVLLLLWVYYSAQILFFGAEITKVYATRFGARLDPAPYARWISPPRPKVRSDLQAILKKRTLDEPHPARQARLISELKEEVESLREIVRH